MSARSETALRGGVGVPRDGAVGRLAQQRLVLGPGADDRLDRPLSASRCRLREMIQAPAVSSASSALRSNTASPSPAGLHGAACGLQPRAGVDRPVAGEGDPGVAGFGDEVGDRCPAHLAAPQRDGGRPSGNEKRTNRRLRDGSKTNRKMQAQVGIHGCFFITIAAARLSYRDACALSMDKNGPNHD